MAGTISNVTAAPVALSQEVTAALGVLNFDFSLVKVEAPAEYNALGASLSSSRRSAAEEGQIHETARKLRALFDPIIPDVPHLTKAYGKRASEIASSSSLDSKSRRIAGAFAAHVGIDGSSLWAAATSGPSAISVHLLGCMLARIWRPPEATSIWEEIVLKRKKELSAAPSDDPMNFHQLMAAKVSLTRSQLADWDASARSWLLAADEANFLNQKKLRLIIDNVRHVPVNVKAGVYESVIQAWSTALKVADRLISGMPQSIQDGAALLGLSAWHLYPSMMVLGESSTEVKMDDPLIRDTGILTLGLSYVGRKQDTDLAEEGIFWSLPLAHLRYYGRPVLSKSALSVQDSRLSIRELVQISLGSMFQDWSQQSTGITTAMNCLVSYWKCIDGVEKEIKMKKKLASTDAYKPSLSSWLGILALEAQSMLSCPADKQHEAMKLFNFGRRRNLKFLGANRDRPPVMYGLCQPSILLPLLRNDDDRINILRIAASRISCDPQTLMIRYRKNDEKGMPIPRFYYASVVPLEVLSGISAVTVKKAHRRWLAAEQDLYETLEDSESQVKISNSDIIGPLQGSTKLFWCNAPMVPKEQYLTIEVDSYFGRFAELALFKGDVDKRKPRSMTGIPFRFLFGDPDIAAIYAASDPQEPQAAPPSTGFSVTEVNDALMNAQLRPAPLLQRAIETLLEYPVYARSMKALATVFRIYASLDGATFPMSITQHPLSEAKWLPKQSELTGRTGKNGEYYPLLSRITRGQTLTTYASDIAEQVTEIFEPFPGNRGLAFACIASFELGGQSIFSEGLQSVMAMAAGDSIYIASPLLNDPFESLDLAETKLERVRGNIGRAGLALMIPPKNPNIRDFDPDRWRLVNHFDFDGEVKDCFQGTSLHLSFTDYVLPVDTGQYGARDTEIYMVETIISVHDKGAWVADLDVLGCIYNTTLFRPVKVKKDCVHSPSQRSQPSEAELGLISVDCWDEFLDFPQDTAVIRAHQNWLARLALATISVSRGYLTILLGSTLCWQCASEERKRLRHIQDVAYLL